MDSTPRNFHEEALGINSPLHPFKKYLFHFFDYSIYIYMLSKRYTKTDNNNMEMLFAQHLVWMNHYHSIRIYKSWRTLTPMQSTFPHLTIWQSA